MAEYILAVDIGTSSCKSTVFSKNGETIATVSCDYPVYYPAPGYAEQKPEEWWNGFCKTMPQILAAIKPNEIAAVGVTGQGWSAIAVDKLGEILFNNPIWMDNRAQDDCAKIIGKIPAEDIFELCGNQVAPMYTTPKILWFARQYPDVFKRVYKVLQSNSYFVYKLTGQFTQDTSQGYGLHFFNMKTCEWDSQMASQMGISLDIMPDMYPSSCVVGKITPAAAKHTGLLEGTPVVAGGLDAACSTLGAGVTEPGQTQAQGGTAGGMSLCLDNVKTHPKLIMGRHVVEGRWLLQGGTVGGGGTLRWLKSNVLGIDYKEMSSLAAASSVGSGGLIFLPYMSGERSPIWDKNAQGVYFGLDYSKDKKDIIRATMEGVAFSLLHNVETAYEAGGEIGSFNLVGGIANSPEWLQIIADVTNIPINIPSSDTGTNLGAAILAGVGVGIYRNAMEAVKETVSIRKSYSPNPANHEIYQQYYKIYKNLYQATKNNMYALAEMRGTK